MLGLAAGVKYRSSGKGRYWVHPIPGGNFAEPVKDARLAQYLRIRCIVKSTRASAHERVHAVGGIKPDGSRWNLTQDKAISCIDDGTHVLYIERSEGQRLDVVVATGPAGNKYLKTVAEREQPDKLLSLPTCPEI